MGDAGAFFFFLFLAKAVRFYFTLDYFLIPGEVLGACRKEKLISGGGLCAGFDAECHWRKCWAVALVWGGTGVVWGCAVTISVSSTVSVMNEKRRSMQKRGALPMLGHGRMRKFYCCSELSIKHGY